jgi:hypothetical protein
MIIALLSLFGLPPLIHGEDAAAYQELLASLRAGAFSKPSRDRLNGAFDAN